MTRIWLPELIQSNRGSSYNTLLSRVRNKTSGISIFLLEARGHEVQFTVYSGFFILRFIGYLDPFAWRFSLLTCNSGLAYSSYQPLFLCSVRFLEYFLSMFSLQHVSLFSGSLPLVHFPFRMTDSSTGCSCTTRILTNSKSETTPRRNLTRSNQLRIRLRLERFPDAYPLKINEYGKGYCG